MNHRQAQATAAAKNTGLQKKYYFSVTSTKVGELNSIFLR
jgi:hypothetical protein